MPVSAGDCFVLPDSGGDHLYIVATDYKGDPPSVILVNFTSWTRRKDPTVIVDVGDHRWFKNKTVVAYDRAEIVEEWRITHLLRLGRSEEPASPELLKKVRDGLEVSPNVAQKIVDFYKSLSSI